MNFKPQVDPSHYANLGYDHKERFLSYWHQIEQVIKRQPERVLEVGIGNGFLHRYLRNAGVDVHTLDFDPDLEPDTVGSVLDLPFDNGSFDVVCCFETLEHLPWDVFATAVRELKRVSSRWVLLSLPDVTPYVRVDLEQSLHKPARLFRDLPNLRPRHHEFNGEHYWEVGKRGTPLRKVRRALTDEGLKIEECFRVFEKPYHRFLSCTI